MVILMHEYSSDEVKTENLDGANFLYFHQELENLAYDNIEKWTRIYSLALRSPIPSVRIVPRASRESRQRMCNRRKTLAQIRVIIESDEGFAYIGRDWCSQNPNSRKIIVLNLFIIIKSAVEFVLHLQRKTLEINVSTFLMYLSASLSKISTWFACKHWPI